MTDKDTKASHLDTAKELIKAYSGKAKIVTIPILYIQMLGDMNTAALLNQIIYWSDRTQDPDGWFYKSYPEWEEELGLSRYQVTRAMGKDKRPRKTQSGLTLQDVGVEVTRKRIKRGGVCNHFRIDMEKLTAAIVNFVNNQNVNNVADQNVNNVTHRMLTMSQIDYTEITTETTTETTSKEKDSTPIGVSDDFSIESQYSVRVGEDWLPVYWKSKGIKPVKPKKHAEHFSVLCEVFQVNPAELLKKDQKLFWSAAAQLQKKGLTLQGIRALHWEVGDLARIEGWSRPFGPMALVKHADGYLKRIAGVRNLVPIYPPEEPLDEDFVPIPWEEMQRRMAEIAASKAWVDEYTLTTPADIDRMLGKTA